MQRDIDTSPIVLDIETAGLPNAAEYFDPIPDAVPDLSPIEADKRLVDPAKIFADTERKFLAREKANLDAQAKVEAARAQQLEKCSLDWNLGRIVAVGWWTASMGAEIGAFACPDEADERRVLTAVWKAARMRQIVGFAIKQFDLPYMIQRSRYLDIPYPDLDLGRFGRSAITDLYLKLTFNEGRFDQGVMKRTLSAFCRRFGIPVADTLSGKDIGALVAAGDWDGVLAHVRSDVGLTVALARRLGVISRVPVFPAVDPEPEPVVVL